MTTPTAQYIRTLLQAERRAHRIHSDAEMVAHLKSQGICVSPTLLARYRAGKVGDGAQMLVRLAMEHGAQKG